MAVLFWSGDIRPTYEEITRLDLPFASFPQGVDQLEEDSSMQLGRLKILVLVSALCAVMCGLGAPGAVAKPGPSVSLTLTPSVSENSSIPFSWSAKRLGPGHRLVVQRPFGTARVWKTVLKLSADSGSGALPGRTLGRYRYRVAAFRGRKLLAVRVAGVSVFGPVPLSTLLDGDTQNYTTDSSSFPYVYMQAVEDQTISLFSVAKNHCSAVHISFLPGEKYASGKATVTVVQESADPVSTTVPFEQTGTVDATLVPGQTWGVNAFAAGDDRYSIARIYINGYAICSSAEPF